MTLIYHYSACKTRKIEYLNSEEKNNFEKVKHVAEAEGLKYLIGIIDSVEYSFKHEHVDILWNTVHEALKTIAARQTEFIVQMIDEFQFLNAMIYRDKNLKILANDLAGGCLSTAESKIAPLLVSGSWVGWLMNELNMMLPSRFRYEYLENMPEDEAVEMIYKYCRFFEDPITEETAYFLTKVFCE